MARPFRFEEGGKVDAQAGADNRHNDGDFMLPSDVQPEEVLSEIQDCLRAKRFSMPKPSNSTAPSLKKTVDGSVFVPAEVVLQLGDGAIDRGKRVLEKDRQRDPASAGVGPLADPIGAVKRALIFAVTAYPTPTSRREVPNQPGRC